MTANDPDVRRSTAERWEDVKAVLHQALEISPDRRSQFLDEACSADASLRAEVESLLLADEGVRSSFLQSLPPDNPSLDSNGFASPFALEAGQIFAERFQLLRKLGEGGMGQVWLVDQISPVRRQVALKLIKAGMYDEAVVQRFQAERQSLAIMDHPAIAKVFDAGATPHGQPYFVMEYVPGLPITEYCDCKKLKIGDRLELFIQACEGVQHAHQKAIIHRDLKPANILVIEVDGEPVPRIIDFGLAKATTPRVEGESLFTQAGHLVGTPGYMSPEQADPNVLEGVYNIDTRTDVYSLGVVLYELLAGSRPFDTKPGKKQPLDELLRRLREEEPPSPSYKMSGDRDTSTAVAEARGTEPKQLVSLLRGDLDWITLKALERDRARRYNAPSELAADIRRYLNHEAIEARPASAGYRTRKYIRRHRVVVGAAAGLVLLLASFSILQAVQLRRTTRERDRANSERDRATRITDFMTNMFKVADPSEARGKSVTAKEILDKASTEMEQGLAADPQVQSQMMQVMATTYSNLGLYPRAQDLAKRALDVRMSLLGSDDRKTLESETQLGKILGREGIYFDAEMSEREALASERRILGAEDPLTLETMSLLADIVVHHADQLEAEKLERQVIEVATRKLGPESDLVLRSRHVLGVSLWLQGRYAEAEQDGRQLLDVERRVWGPDHPETLRAMNNLAEAIRFQGRGAEAEQIYRELVVTDRRVFGSEHQTTALAISNLGELLDHEGKTAEAEPLLREAVAIQSQVIGPENEYTLQSGYTLANVLFEEGKVREAEKLHREVLATMNHALFPGHPQTLICQSYLARDLIGEGRYREAEKLARTAFETDLRNLGPQRVFTMTALQQLGIALALTDRYAEAKKLFRDVIEKQDNIQGHWDALPIGYYFACVAAASNHSEDALQSLREAINNGFRETDYLISDPDLKKLRPNPKFQQIIAELKQSLPMSSTMAH
jgi:serine/threonine protein kinase